MRQVTWLLPDPAAASDRTVVRAEQTLNSTQKFHGDEASAFEIDTKDGAGQRAELVEEPPADHRRVPRAQRSVGTPRLDKKRHETDAPAPVLAAQLLQGFPVLVIHGVAGLVDNGPTGTQDTVEDVEIAATGQRRTGVESLAAR